MKVRVDWDTLKALQLAKNISLQYIDVDNTYYISLYDGQFNCHCTIDKVDDPAVDSAQYDFEQNYKADANINLRQLDTDGAQIVRQKAAKKGWTYAALPLEFNTARLSDSLWSEEVSGQARSYITLKAYDSNNNEVTTPGLLDINYASICKTIIDIEPPYDYEVIGGSLRTSSSISNDIRLWIIAVPDIPVNMGGSKEMAGGINLKFLTPGNVYEVDGRVSKYLTYDANLHTNKLRFIFKYPAGTYESLSVVLEMYRG